VTDVRNAASNAAQLTPDQTFGNITNTSVTISSSGSQNVIQIANISLTNSANRLIFSGGANDFFIVNVTGTISLSGGAQILTDGELPASNLLFNVEGTGDSVKMSNSNSVLTGTYLAPNPNQKITLSPGTLNGAIIGYQIQTSSGPTDEGAIYTTGPSNVTLTVTKSGGGGGERFLESGGHCLRGDLQRGI